MSLIGKRYDVAPGPARWDRARANAEKNPTSHGAKLYKSRLALAWRLTHEKAYEDVVYAFQRNQGGYWNRAEYPEWKRKHTVCSRFCALLHVQLSLGDKACEATVHDAMMGTPYHSDGERIVAVQPGELKRPVRCFVCGCQIEKDLVPSGTSFAGVQPQPQPEPVTAGKIRLPAETLRSIIDSLNDVEASASGIGRFSVGTIVIEEDGVNIVADWDFAEWYLEFKQA